MDPKQLNNLDPKLKEVFDRVMSTKVVPKPVGTNQQAISSQSPLLQPQPIQGMPNAQPFLQPAESIPSTQSSMPSMNQPLPAPEFTEPKVEAPTIASDSLSSTASFAPSLQEMPTLSSHASGFSAATSSPANAATTTTIPTQKKSSPLFTLLITVLMIIFFVVYSFFWMRFFNITLPF